MGPLCRALDWSATPLGPVEQWSESLRTSAALVARQGIAMNLCWGPDLLQIYNDAYRVIMGNKHPLGLGRSVLWSWAEIREEIEPLFERVMAGETVYFEDRLLRVERHGAIEDAYFTFSYSPIRVESGAVGAALINCYETTRQVQARAVQADRDRLFEELRVERARLAHIFKNAPAFLAVLRGRDHVFELANDSYYQLVGHRPLIGRPVRDAVPEAIGQGFIDLLDGVLSTGIPHLGRETRITLQREPLGPAEEVFIDFQYLPYTEADGSHSGIIAHGVDVTEQVRARHAAERLLRDAQDARQEAELANRAKAEFLAAMSHELRTPLNAIGGYADLIAMGIHGPVTDAQRDSLRRVSASQRHLLTLINDILAHARLEAGRMEFDLRALDVRDFLAGIEPFIAPLADARQITYTVAMCDAGIRICADEERLRQVLLNLITNAFKFTRAGGSVTVACTVHDERVDIHVADTGRGIPADKLEAIFDPFMQVGRALNRPEAGVGLGLAISRDLATGMHGSLTVRSVVGAGSTFTVTVPRA